MKHIIQHLFFLRPALKGGAGTGKHYRILKTVWFHVNKTECLKYRREKIEHEIYVAMYKE